MFEVALESRRLLPSIVAFEVDERIEGEDAADAVGRIAFIRNNE
jgi:hypothetical protein